MFYKQFNYTQAFIASLRNKKRYKDKGCTIKRLIVCNSCLCHGTYYEGSSIALLSTSNPPSRGI